MLRNLTLRVLSPTTVEIPGASSCGCASIVGTRSVRGHILLVVLSVHGAAIVALAGRLLPAASPPEEVPTLSVDWLPAARMAAPATPPTNQAPPPRPRQKPAPAIPAQATATLVTASASQPAPAEAAPAAALPPPATAIAATPPAAPTAPRFDADYLSNPAPDYPRLARELGEEGRVQLSVHVTAQGRPSEIQIHRSSGFERLDRAAQQAVWRWEFVPARLGRETQAGWVIVPINFSLRR